VYIPATTFLLFFSLDVMVIWALIRNVAKKFPVDRGKNKIGVKTD
jgi:uncharacterized protein YggT (Ycf19 family)